MPVRDNDLDARLNAEMESPPFMSSGFEPRSLIASFVPGGVNSKSGPSGVILSPLP